MLVIPSDILHFKLTIIDGISGEKEDDNEDTMLDKAIKAVFVQDGIMLHPGFKTSSCLRFFLLDLRCFGPQYTDSF